jgi:hypothetical protein
MNIGLLLLSSAMSLQENEAASTSNPIVDDVMDSTSKGSEAANLEGEQWSDVGKDNDGLICISGMPLEDLSSRQLRTLCSRLGVKGVKNAKKCKMIEMVTGIYRNKAAYKDLQIAVPSTANVPRKQIQCSFRLLNILFSDDFAERFGSIGNVADRALLDSGKAGSDEYFWEAVQLAFLTPKPEYDIMLFMEDDVFSCREDIDPSKIISHNWKKLRSIWKGINADYKAALSRFTISGTHSSDFYNFCHGKLEPYYLRKHLELRPDLTGAVEADLPEETFLSSSMSGDEVMAKCSSDSSTATNQRKRERDTASLSEVVKAMSDSTRLQTEQAQVKMHYLQREDTRRESEEQRRVGEALELARKYRFEEWERIQANIRLLRHDLLDNTLEEASRVDLNNDIEVLVQRKNELSSELGLTKK